MTAGLLILSGVKASILALCGLASVHLLPQAWVRARRRLALLMMWSLLVLPWWAFSLPEVLPVTAKIPLLGVHATVAWTTALLAVWALGALARACRLALESRILFRLAGGGSRFGERMLMVEGLDTPCMWGVIRPCILMPVAAKEWSAAQWQAAVAHEQQHIRQHDGFHRMIAGVVRCLFWWNPLVHSLCRRMEIESELCCDEAATVTSSRRDYGEMLLNLAVASSYETVPAWASTSGVRERIQRLIAPAPCSRFSAWGRALTVTGVVFMGLATGCCIDGVESPVTGNKLSQEAALRLSAEAFPLH